MQADERFSDLELGLVDASVVVLAEELGVRRSATRDVPHFSAIRFGDARVFEFVVQSSDPDRAEIVAVEKLSMSF